MLHKIRDYRWELGLFFGVPASSWLLEWVIYPVFSPLTYTSSSWNTFWLNLPGLVASAGVLAVSYLWVRRLKRPLLRLLWQHSLVSVAIVIAVLLFTATLLYDEDVTPLHQGLTGTLAVFLSIPAGLAALIWFARSASRGGFKYALVFLGITAIPGLQALPVQVANGTLAIWSLWLYFGGITFSVMLTLVGVWVLRRADSGGIVTRRTIVTLFFVALSGQVFFSVVRPLTYWNVVEWSITTGLMTGGWVLHYVVAVGLAYLVRVREIEPHFDPGDGPPPDEGPEPPTDGVTDEFVGLYRRKVEPL